MFALFCLKSSDSSYNLDLGKYKDELSLEFN